VVPELLARGDVGDVHLDDRDGGERQRVAQPIE
jgi:hypothetical protein